jgi:predicted PurR-regulated permease PerM
MSSRGGAVANEGIATQLGLRSQDLYTNPGGANMNSEGPTAPLVKSVVVFAGVAIVILAMRAASDILSPVLLAMVLAISVAPLLDWFMRRGAPAWLALVLTIVLTVLLILGIVWLVGLSVQDFADKLPAYEKRFGEIEQTLGTTLTNLGVDVDNLTADPIIAPEGLLELVAGFAGGIVSGLSNWGLILLTTAFFLVEATVMPRKVQNVTEEGDPDVVRVLRLNQDLRQYMAINAGVGLLAAILNVILLAVIGVDFALLWGVLSFFMSFIPSVGFLISVIPPALMALIQFGVPEMLIVVVLYIVINFVVDNVIKPRFIEEGVNISVLMTFLSLILWGWVLGPIGAILAVPMAIIVQAILASREETRWLAYMMGSGREPFESGAEPDQTVEGGGLVPEGGG